MQRSKGHSAVAAAAYRARMELTNERTGQVWDYSRKHDDVLFEGIYLPKGAPEWMKDRSELWNSVERAEKRKDAQVARDFIIGLPHELTTEQQRYALQDWVRENFTRKGYVADVAIHRAPELGDERNAHAHILVTTRAVDGLEFARSKDAKAGQVDDVERWRESWERIGNRHLERHGHEPTLDRRTLEAQGIDRIPTIHLGRDAQEMERAGIETARGDALRQIQAENLQRELEQVYDHKVTVQELHRTLMQEPPAQVRSAVERLREEEREAELPRGRQSLNEGSRGILAAIWSLTRTMGGTLAHIILGADRADLMMGRVRIDREAWGAPTRNQAEPHAPIREKTDGEREASERRQIEREQERDTLREAQGLIQERTMADRLETAVNKRLAEITLRELAETQEKERQQSAAEIAAALFARYNAPRIEQEQRREQERAAAWAPQRQDLSRVETLMQALREPVMLPEAQEPEQHPERKETLAERLKRQAAERGEPLENRRIEWLEAKREMTMQQRRPRRPEDDELNA